MVKLNSVAVIYRLIDSSQVHQHQSLLEFKCINALIKATVLGQRLYFAVTDETSFYKD